MVHQCQHFHTISVHSQLLMMRVRILKHVWRGRSLGGSASSIATCEIRNSVHQICCCRGAWHLIHVEVERHPQAEENLEHLSDVCFGMPVEWCSTYGKQHTEKFFSVSQASFIHCFSFLFEFCLVLVNAPNFSVSSGGSHHFLMCFTARTGATCELHQFNASANLQCILGA